MVNSKASLSAVIFSIIIAAVFGCLTGCFTTDKYHNKRHFDTIKKDLDSAHGDIDRVLGLDEPSLLVEEK